MTGRMHAARIRETLTAKLLENHNGPRIIIHELGLRKGDCRVDVALVTERITGFEIKSDANGWNRLDGQVRMYSRALDEATLIVGRRTDSGRKRIPGWWGLWSARKDGRELGIIREAQPNPDRKARAVADVSVAGRSTRAGTVPRDRARSPEQGPERDLGPPGGQGADRDPPRGGRRSAPDTTLRQRGRTQPEPHAERPKEVKPSSRKAKMLQDGHGERSAADRYDTPVPSGKVPHIPQARSAYVERRRPARWWERVLGRRTGYTRTPIRVWLYHYAGDADYDGPVLIIRNDVIERARITTGSMIVLDDDVGTTTVGRKAPPAAMVRWISIGRRNNRIVLCHWWLRRREGDGTVTPKNRTDRQDELLGMIHAR